MVKFSIALGFALVLVGLIGYLATGRESITALIPAFFGLIFYILGRIGQRSDQARKHTMHAAAALALVGFLGSVRGLFQLFTILGGGTVERAPAVYAQSAMAVLCLIFVIFAVKSFIDARRARS